ncbi:MAG: hypothetical protein JWQ97_809 [Phenylobacterium sp.]|nr:hypothetical protein [Phenylobacterium sp.]
MAAGMQPVSCKPAGAKVSAPADRRQDQGGASGAALELWNGVREGMTPDQVAALLPAPYHWPTPPAAPFGDHHPVSDGVLAPAALFGHPAIAEVLFDDHAAKIVNLHIDPPSDNPEQNLSLARELLSRFDAAYGTSLQVTDQGGDLSAVWRRGDLSIDLEYMPLPDQPPTFMVIFKREDAAEHRAAPPIDAIPAPGLVGA